MPPVIVVNHPKNWPFEIPGVEVLGAREYLTRPELAERKDLKVFNLCRSYKYQTIGYYVTLLAAARGHRPLPSIGTIQDLRSQAMARVVSEDLDRLIQKSLRPIASDRFTLSVYFGRNVAKRYDALARELFRLFEAPLLRAQFARTDRWELRSIGPISTGEIPDAHRDFVLEVAAEYFRRKRPPRARRVTARYDLAILVNPAEELPPSDEQALRRFLRAAEAVGLRAELIEPGDFGRLAEFDALFLRETTSVRHHTYRFARRAAFEGLAVIDDPESIVKCTNKVFLAELLARHRIPTPKTLVVHKDNVGEIVPRLGLPCVLKQPDSSFSQGVVKAETEEELAALARRLLEDSELVIAQEFLPTPFDWRIGLLEGEPLYACKYYMAPRHWQIYRRSGGRTTAGKWETVAVELAPPRVVRTAVRAARLVGDGLYGVDLKQKGRDVWVMEINDNPSIDAGVEDAWLGDELYRRIMASFLRRIERLKRGGSLG